MKEYAADAIAPVVKRLSLKAPPARAFAHFTENISVWWPLATHSLSRAAARRVVFEAKKGGRIFETDVTGREREWGRVRACEPPRRVVFSWVLEKPADASEIEVTFEDDGKGGTNFTLTHRGWLETKSSVARRALYDQRWMAVLAGYERSI